MITFSPLEVLAARESTVPPSLKLTVTARPFFAQTTAGAARSGHGAVQALTIPGWVRRRRRCIRFGLAPFSGDVLGVPKRTFWAVCPPWSCGGGSSPPAATWVAPGWAVVTYDVPASMVSPRGRLTLGLGENRHGGGVIAWNGSPHVRWVLVSLRSGTATATIDDIPWRGLVTLPRPTPSWWYQHVEEASIQGVAAEPSIPASVSPGGHRRTATAPLPTEVSHGPARVCSITRFMGRCFRHLASSTSLRCWAARWCSGGGRRELARRTSGSRETRRHRPAARSTPSRGTWFPLLAW